MIEPAKIPRPLVRGGVIYPGMRPALFGSLLDIRQPGQTCKDGSNVLEVSVRSALRTSTPRSKCNV